MFQPTLLPARLGLLALGLAVLLSGPSPAVASTVVVPDDSSTVQGGINSYADTVLVRAGTYPESVLVLPQFKPVVLIADPAASPRPTLDYLKVWAQHSHRGSIKVVGLRITDPVVIWSHNVSARFDFESCTFDGGLGHGGVWIDPDHAGGGTSLIRCMIRRGIALTTGTLTVESDTVEAGGASFETQSASVRNCWFRGPAGLGLSHRSPMNCVVSDNVFEDCSPGIWVHDDFNTSFFSIQNNVIRRGQGWGIWMEHAEYVEILGNDIRDSGGGIKANISGNTTFRVIGNTVIGCRGNGMDLEKGDFDIEVRSNTVLRCLGSGIRVQGFDNGSVANRVISNTCALNEGPGFDIAINYQYIQPLGTVVSNNASYGNGSWGLRWTSNEMPTLGCNDWFSNTAGAVSGAAASVTDLSVDPLFCDITTNDVRLRSDSPLLDAAGCGQIGALGVGCGVTATLVQRFAAARATGGIRVVWEVAEGATASAIWVERAEGADGQAWTRPVMERFTDGGSVVELDRSALPDHTYRYRLVAMDGGKFLVLDPGILVEGQARLSFALAQVGPSPGGGPLRIGFALAHAAAIRIDVFDLLGRRVATPAMGMRPAGMQTAEWDGLTHAGRTAPAGMYVIQYRYPGGTDKRPVVRVP